MKRPVSVTIISWIFILGGAITVQALLRQVTNAETGPDMRGFIAAYPGHYAFTHVAAILIIVCGIFMLFGYNWARWLVFVWFIQATIADAMVAPAHAWNPCVIFVPAVYFLFRRPASDYFRNRKQKRES